MAKSVGELNGRWAMLFKFVMVLAPIFASAQMVAATWMFLQIVELREFRATVQTTDCPAQFEKIDDSIRRIELAAAKKEKGDG